MELTYDHYQRRAYQEFAILEDISTEMQSCVGSDSSEVAEWSNGMSGVEGNNDISPLSQATYPSDTRNIARQATYRILFGRPMESQFTQQRPSCDASIWMQTHGDFEFEDMDMTIPSIDGMPPPLDQIETEARDQTIEAEAMQQILSSMELEEYSLADSKNSVDETEIGKMLLTPS